MSQEDEDLKLVEKKSTIIASMGDGEDYESLTEDDHWQDFDDSDEEIEALELLARAEDNLMKECMNSKMRELPGDNSQACGMMNTEIETGQACGGMDDSQANGGLDRNIECGREIVTSRAYDGKIETSQTSDGLDKNQASGRMDKSMTYGGELVTSQACGGVIETS